MKLSKTLIALLGVLLLGATAAFAWDGSGTGTGTCTEGSIGDKAGGPVGTGHFHPFAVWSGHFTGVGFTGTWVDNANNRHGTFAGNYYDPAPPQWESNERISVGHWYVFVNNTQQEEMGTYELHMEVYLTGEANGEWTTTNPDWYGSGEMTGDDPNIPLPDEE